MFKKLISLLFVIFTICLLKTPANAAIAFVSGSNVASPNCSSAANCTVTLGTINNGNVVFFSGFTSSTSGMNTSALPSGGSSPVVCPVAHGFYFHCYKTWFTGDPTTYQFANVTGTSTWEIVSGAWSGNDTTTSIDEYAETVAGGANGSTIYLPAVGGHFDGEMRIGSCVANNGSGSLTTPTGMTSRSSSIHGPIGLFDLTGGPLSNTTPVPTLSCGNPNGSGSPDTGVTWLVKPAGAVADTYNPVAGLACYGWSGHVHDTMDMTNCNLQNGDLVETCTEGFLNSGSYGNLPALVPPAKFTASIARDYFYSQIYNSRCTYGYWHTGDPQTFAWGWNGQTSPGSGNVSGDTNYIVHRVPSGTAYIGPANQPAPTFSSATTISQSITTTQPYSTLLLNIQSNGSATGFSSSPSGSFLINNGMNIANADQATFQLDAYTSGSQGAKTFVFNSGTPDTNIYSWIVTATNPFAGLGYVSSSTCSNSATSTISCTPSTGTAGDLLLAAIFELSDPGQSTLNALTPAGWTLLKYQNDTSQGLVGVTVPDTSTVFLGTLQQDLATSIQVLPSGTAAYTIHGCAQTPVSWGGGGGLLGVNNNFNGTNDTLDRALRMNSSGQWMYSHGATGSLLSGATTLTSPLTYNDGHPHCVAGTFDGTNMNLYVDGSLVAGPTAPSTANVTLPTTGYWVGGYTKQPGFFYGAPFVIGQLAVWNGTALSGAQVASLAAHTTDGFFDSTMSSLSPSYWWKLNETAPNQPAVDSGSGGNTGIYYQFRGILNQTSVGGMGDKSPYFGGSFLNGGGGSPQVQVANPINWSTNFSWEAFVKLPSGSVGGLIGLSSNQYGGSNNMQYGLYVDSNNKVAFGIQIGGGSGASGVNSAAVVNDNAVHLIDGTWNGTTLAVYLDNVEVSSTPGTSTTGASSMYPVIGLGETYANFPNTTTQNSGTGLFNAGAAPGVYGRVSMWNGVTLTSGQVSNHYAHRNDGTYDAVILADSPTSFWKLNETNGAGTAIDYGSAANNGTYTNMQTEAWAIWEKTRAVSESAVAFPLGQSVNALGTVIDVSNVLNSIDGSNFFDNSGLNSTSYVFGQSIIPANAFELNLLGGNGTSAPPAGTPGIATLQAANSSVMFAYAGASPYQGTFADIGGLTYMSGTWNLGMNLLMPEGVPPPISGGKIIDVYRTVKMKYLKYLLFVLVFVVGCSSMNTPVPHIGPLKLNNSNYVPIPDSNGVTFLNNLNNALSGVTGIEPQFDTYTEATLPSVTQNRVVFCQDCSTTQLSCTGGGTGTLAFNTGSAWLCLSATSSSATSPGGTNGAIQYNNSSSFGGAVITGLVKGNGTSAPTAASAGTDYQSPIAGNTLSTHNFANSISSAGTISGAQPACGDLSNSGTACQATTGTSGTTVPLLNGTNTWSGEQTFGTTNYNCSGGVTLSSGSGTITNACITASCKVFGCNDTTTSGALFSVTPGSGSAAVTLTSGGTNTDVIAGCVFWGC